MTNSPNKIVSIYSAFPSKEEAERIAEILVQEHLVACANIFPEGTSIYIWKNKATKDKETYAFFKTSLERSEKASQRIKELHSFEVPAILVFEVEARPEYLKWINESGLQP